MSDPFDSAKSGIQNAKRNLAEFEWEMREFANNNPYTFVIETNADRTEDFHKYKLTKAIPPLLPDKAFDVCSNLRASLDRAGFATAVAAGKDGKNSHFPFGSTFAEVQGCRARRSRDIPDAIFDLMVSFEPYQGGNDLLWALNKLCNTNKHEIVVPMMTATSGIIIRPASGTNLVISDHLSYQFPPPWDSVKNEMVVFHVRHGVKLNLDVLVQFFVALGKIEAIGREPAAGILNAMASEVERIIMAIEAEARRLGLLQ
jgi:hypothetical protein